MTDMKTMKITMTNMTSTDNQQPATGPSMVVRTGS